MVTGSDKQMCDSMPSFPFTLDTVQLSPVASCRAASADQFASNGFGSLSISKSCEMISTVLRTPVPPMSHAGTCWFLHRLAFNLTCLQNVDAPLGRLTVAILALALALVLSLVFIM